MASSGATQGRQSSTTASLQQVVKQLYPDILCKTICVPPVHFNRVPYTADSVSGEPVLVVKPPSGAAPTVSSVPSGSQANSSQGNSSQANSSQINSSQANSSQANSLHVGASAAAPQGPGTQSTSASSTSSILQGVLKGISALFPHTTPGQVAGFAQNVISHTRQQYQSSQPPDHSLWTSEPQPPIAPLPVFDSDVRDDFAQQHVVTNLQALGDRRGEVMFILSQLDFMGYLNKPSFKRATRTYPRLAKLPHSHREGDFDVMIFHRHHGILLGELKAVGKNHAELQKTEADADADISKRVAKAAKQLNKSETVLKHLVGDIAPGLTVKKSIFLPYVNSAQLQRVLASDSKLEQLVCQSLGASNAQEASQLCLCSDQLSDPVRHWQVTPDVLLQLDSWWQKRMAATVDPLLTDHLYLEIVARFVGPATTVSIHSNAAPRVEVRTEGEAVEELGQMLARLILTSQQVDLLNIGPPHVWIIGPPGTGKTLVLVLRGLWCLRHGYDVHILSFCAEQVAVAHVIYHQLQMTVANDPPSTSLGTVSIHTYALNERPAEYVSLMATLAGVFTANPSRPQFFIVDDILQIRSTGLHVGDLLYQMVRGKGWASSVSVWISSMQLKPELFPQGFPVVSFTIPLRCTPVIQREVEPGLKLCGAQPYSRAAIPAPSDGLKIVRLCHLGPTHSSLWPIDCWQCGADVAEVLLNKFNVGCAGHNALPNSPSNPQYKDVFILTRSEDLRDHVIDSSGRVESPASDLVRGLRDKGLPVQVLHRSSGGNNAGWEKDIADTALAKNNVVAAVNSSDVRGLERKVVVWVPDWRHEFFDEDSDSDSDREPESEQTKKVLSAEERLLAKSRCTTQLIMVDLPQRKKKKTQLEPDLD